MNNPVPPITDELGLATWAKEQPNANDFMFTQDIVYMSKEDFLRLKEYSFSYPSGVYAGKMWRCCVVEKWFLCWYFYNGVNYNVRFIKLLYY